MKILKRVLKFVKSLLKYSLYAVLLLIVIIGIWVLYTNHLKNGFSDGYTESSIEPNHDKETYSDYQSILDAISKDYDSAGIQATIVFKNGEKWTGASGYANHSEKIPITNQSLFAANFLSFQEQEMKIGLAVGRKVDLASLENLQIMASFSLNNNAYSWNEDDTSGNGVMWPNNV